MGSSTLLPPPRIDASSAGMRMTRAQFEAAEDWDEIFDYELINGVLVVRPGLDYPNGEMVEELGYRLRTYQEKHPSGRSLDFTVYGKYVATAHDYRRTHRSVWTGLGRMPKKRDVPSIVIEMIAKGRVGMLENQIATRDEYFFVGVKEVWVFDRFKRRLTVSLNRGDGVEEVVFGDSDCYESVLLPGFILEFSRYLAGAAKWDDD